MKKELEQYFGCEVKIAEYKNKLPLPIFMTMRDIVMVEIYGVTFAIIDVMKETELSVAAMKKQKAKYEEALQCPVAYEVAINNVSMRNALVKSGVPFVNLPGNVFLPFMGIVLQDVYRKQLVKADKMMPATQMVFLELLYMSDEECGSGKKYKKCCISKYEKAARILQDIYNQKNVDYTIPGAGFLDDSILEYEGPQEKLKNKHDKDIIEKIIELSEKEEIRKKP